MRLKRVFRLLLVLLIVVGSFCSFWLLSSFLGILMALGNNTGYLIRYTTDLRRIDVELDLQQICARADSSGYTWEKHLKGEDWVVCVKYGARGLQVGIESEDGDNVTAVCVIAHRRALRLLSAPVQITVIIAIDELGYAQLTIPTRYKLFNCYAAFVPVFKNLGLPVSLLYQFKFEEKHGWPIWI